MDNRAPKSKTAPPGYVFGIVWTILYALLGYVVARLFYMYRKSSGNNRHVILAAMIFGVLAFGISIYWVYLFGCKHKPREALALRVAGLCIPCHDALVPCGTIKCGAGRAHCASYGMVHICLDDEPPNCQ